MLIYKATNLINGKIYIGKTMRTLQERIQDHKEAFRYKDTVFYNAIKKYGIENFYWEVIEEVFDSKKLDEREIFWIKELDSIIDNKHGYNMTWGGDGGVITDAVRGKISKYASEKRLSDKWKANIGNSVRGEKNGFYGRKHSEETKQKLREIAKKRTFSEETRKKISLAHSGVSLSEDHRKKISLSNTGIIFSDEHKRKISEAKKRYYERRRLESTNAR